MDKLQRLYKEFGKKQDNESISSIANIFYDMGTKKEKSKKDGNRTI